MGFSWPRSSTSDRTFVNMVRFSPFETVKFVTMNIADLQNMKMCSSAGYSTFRRNVRYSVHLHLLQRK
jgi:hypothetical protein